MIIDQTGNKPGRKRLIPKWAIAKLENRPQKPRGFKSYREIQQWLDSECGIKVRYHVVHSLVRYRLRAKRKKPRPLRHNEDLDKKSDYATRSRPIANKIDQVTSNYEQRRKRHSIKHRYFT